MKTVEIPLPQLAAIAATRALGGAGIGLLVSPTLTDDHRKAAGWILLGIGALTTVPLLISLVSRIRSR